MEQTGCMTVAGGEYLDIVHVPCVFPFNVGDQKNITGCISTMWKNAWCATKTDENGDYMGHHGRCPEQCTGR